MVSQDSKKQPWKQAILLYKRNEKRKDYEEIDPKIKCAKEQIKDLFLNSSPFINPSVVILGMVMGAGCKFLYKKIKERRQRKKSPILLKS